MRWSDCCLFCCSFSSYKSQIKQVKKEKENGGRKNEWLWAREYAYKGGFSMKKRILVCCRDVIACLSCPIVWFDFFVSSFRFASDSNKYQSRNSNRMEVKKQ